MAPSGFCGLLEISKKRKEDSQSPSKIRCMPGITQENEGTYHSAMVSPTRVNGENEKERGGGDENKC